MANIISLSTLYGCHYYQPVKILEIECGPTMRRMSDISNEYLNDHVQCDLNNLDINFSLLDLNIGLKARKDRHVTKCNLVKYQCKLQQAPDSPLFIFERDKKDWMKREFEKG